MLMAEITENNGRSWAGVLVGAVDIGFGTYVFWWTPSVGVSMSSVSHGVCVEGSCALVKADLPRGYIFTL